MSGEEINAIYDFGLYFEWYIQRQFIEMNQE